LRGLKARTVCLFFNLASEITLATIQIGSQSYPKQQELMGWNMSGKADGDLVRRQNRNAILSALRRFGSQPRVELGRVTGLSPASVTTISAQLIEDGLIAEQQQPFGQPVSELIEIRRGRPSVRLALNPDAAIVLAAKLSGEGLECSISDFSGAALAHHLVKLPTPLFSTEQPADISAFIIAELHRFCAAYQPNLVGIAVQGHADLTSGVLRWSPAFAARNISLVEPVEQALGARWSPHCLYLSGLWRGHGDDHQPPRLSRGDGCCV
jgi:hypothetical protein